MLCRVTFEGAMPKKFQQKSWFTEGNYPGIERTKRVTTLVSWVAVNHQNSPPTQNPSMFQDTAHTHFTYPHLLWRRGCHQRLGWSLVVHWHRHTHTHTHTHIHTHVHTHWHIPKMVGKFILTISDRFDVASISHLLNGVVGQNVSTISSYI